MAGAKSYGLGLNRHASPYAQDYRPTLTTRAPSGFMHESLGKSARSALIWGGGFTLVRDVAQFGVMLILVRLLSPEDYGIAAIAQAIIGFSAVISFATFASHALQLRNPAEIDWQAHFTAGVVINAALVALTLTIAFALSFTERYSSVAWPLAALSLVFIVEVPGTIRHRMLESRHDWARFRLLLIIGTFLGLSAGLVVALLGGGVWALVVQPPLFGLPAAFDLLVIQRFRPDWAWSWRRYRETVRFGLDRVGSGLVGRGRVLGENLLLSGVYDLATLGIFTRANGLAVVLAGRIGSITTMSLHPVVTRAERSSPRFQRLAGLVLCGVLWTTLPAILFLGLAAQDTVALLYGARWYDVVALLPLAAAATGIAGVTAALSSLLVANEDSRMALFLDLIAGTTGIAMALVLIPLGIRIYLAGMIIHALLMVFATTLFLFQRQALTGSGIVAAFVPPIVAGLMGVAVVMAVRDLIGVSEYLLVRLLVDALTFAVAYLGTLRVAFTRPLARLLEVVPGGGFLSRMLWMA